MKVWITSDTHFSHENIIKFCNRPFKNVQEMDEILINNWNSLVSDEDIVFHLGDIVLGEHKLDFCQNIDNILKGSKYYIKGNHDGNINKLKEFGLKIEREAVIDKYQIILSHVPLELKDIPKGYLNIHGHIHDKKLPNTFDKDKYFNACVEQNDYKPFLLEDVLRNKRNGRVYSENVTHSWKHTKFDFRAIPTKCDVCGSGKIRYTTNAELYHGKQYGNGYCYLCDNCKCSVGVHDTKSKKPLGRFATKEMKKLKMECHTLLDPYWKSKKFKRTDCYGYLADKLGLLLRETHFGWFDIEYLQKSIFILKNTSNQDLIDYVSSRNIKNKYNSY